MSAHSILLAFLLLGALAGAFGLLLCAAGAGDDDPPPRP